MTLAAFLGTRDRTLSRWVGHRVAVWRRAIPNLLRRLLRQPQRHDVHIGAASIRAGGRITAKGIVGHQEDAPTRELLAYLLRRDKVNQETAQRMGETDEEIRQSVEALRSEIDSLIQAEIRAAKKNFQAARIAGALALVIGLILTTLA